MKSKHRQYLTQAAIQKQKQIESRNKIAVALATVDKQAKKALEYRGSVRWQANQHDVVSSLTTNDGPPRMLKVHSMSPLSDVTNQNNFNGHSLDDTSRALFGSNDSEKKQSISVKSTIESTEMMQIENVSQTYSLNSKQKECQSAVPYQPLSPRRQWELEPLQKALAQFASVKDTFQPIAIPRRDNNALSVPRGKEVPTNQLKFQPQQVVTFPNHSVLDLISSQYISNHGEKRTQDSLCESIKSTIDTQKEPNINAAMNNDDKVYNFQEDSNGAAWIIGSTHKNIDTDSIEGSLCIEMKLEATNASSSGHDEEEYDDSFYSEE